MIPHRKRNIVSRPVLSTSFFEEKFFSAFLEKGFQHLDSCVIHMYIN
jgi:hypothetical protein